MPAYDVTNHAQYGFQIHRHGCKDVARGMTQRHYNGEPWTVEAENPEAAVLAEIADLEESGFEKGDWAVEHFTIMPCAKPKKEELIGTPVVGPGAKDTLYTFKIPAAAGQAIQIDDRSMWPAGVLDYRSIKKGKGHQFEIIAGETIARKMLEDMDGRSSYSSKEGWDQPPYWATACRAGARNLRKALEG